MAVNNNPFTKKIRKRFKIESPRTIYEKMVKNIIENIVRKYIFLFLKYNRKMPPFKGGIFNVNINLKLHLVHQILLQKQVP